MPLLKNMNGQIFGRLTALDRDGIRVHCRCECGVVVLVRRRNLVSGGTRSCGCLNQEVRRSRATHGMTRTPEYYSWIEARRRCLDRAHHKFHDYGARGITMFPVWADNFSAFLSYMGPRPGGMSLDRINNDGHYEPGNCRWATPLVQARNTRQNRQVILGGVSRTISECGEISGLPRSTITSRLNRGWSIEDAMSRR